MAPPWRKPATWPGDAIRCHLQGLLKDGEPIPEDPFVQEKPLIEELKVTV